MKERTRKILTRVGAALMLGMSLFNFGMIWGSQKTERIPRKARNVRRQTEETDVELESIADIAEKEAQAVIMMEQLNQRESQQQIQEENAIITPKFFRYAAISVWVFSATVIFSSTIFNYPLALGKGVLSALPGIPHTAQIVLRSDGEIYNKGQRVEVSAYLDTQFDQVDFVRFAMTYDPQVIELDGYIIDKGKFGVIEERIIDKEKGNIILSMKNNTGGRTIKNKNFMTLYFSAIREKDKTEINLVRDETVVIRADNKKNVLGRIKGTSFGVFE